MNIYFNQMDEKGCVMRAPAQSCYMFSHFSSFKEMYDNIAEALNWGREWISWNFDLILEKNNLTLDDFFSEDGDMLLHDGYDYNDYMMNHLSDLTDKDYADLIKKAILERGEGKWTHKCLVMMKEFDDSKCYEITDKDFDENGKFVGRVADGREAIRTSSMREEFGKILEKNDLDGANVASVITSVKEILEYVAKETHVKSPYSTGFTEYDKAAQVVNNLLFALDGLKE